MIKNNYPLPLIEEIFDKLHEAKYIFEFDHCQAYYQNRLEEKSVPLTAFGISYGLFEFLVFSSWTDERPCNIHVNNEWRLF